MLAAGANTGGTARVAATVQRAARQWPPCPHRHGSPSCMPTPSWPPQPHARNCRPDPHAAAELPRTQPPPCAALTQGQPLDSKGGTGGRVLGEVLSIDGVHSSKVRHVGLRVGGAGAQGGAREHTVSGWPWAAAGLQQGLRVGGRGQQEWPPNDKSSTCSPQRRGCWQATTTAGCSARPVRPGWLTSRMVVFTTFSQLLPAASRMAPRFCITCSACASTPSPAKSLVPGTRPCGEAAKEGHKVTGRRQSTQQQAARPEHGARLTARRAVPLRGRPPNNTHHLAGDVDHAVGLDGLGVGAHRSGGLVRGHHLTGCNRAARGTGETHQLPCMRDAPRARVVLPLPGRSAARAGTARPGCCKHPPAAWTDIVRRCAALRLWRKARCGWLPVCAESLAVVEQTALNTAAAIPNDNLTQPGQPMICDEGHRPPRAPEFRRCARLVAKESGTQAAGTRTPAGCAPIATVVCCPVMLGGSEIAAILIKLSSSLLTRTARHFVIR